MVFVAVVEEMYLCQMLAQAMGAKLGFRSVPGEGTAFWIELPLEMPHPVWHDFEDSALEMPSNPL